MADSDIKISKVKFREKAYTNNIRFSVQLDLGGLLGEESKLNDQFADSTNDI